MIPSRICADLFTIALRNDDIQEFDSKWDGFLLSMTKIPSDDILEGSAHILHNQAILKGSGVAVEAVVHSDASAGIGIASRQGCGRLKHLEVKWLWVQEKVSEKALRLRKHPTETNIADLATQYLSKHRMEML